MSRLLLFVCLCCFLPVGCTTPAHTPRAVQTADGAPRFADAINDPRTPVDVPAPVSQKSSWWGLAAAFGVGMVIGFVSFLALALVISSQIH